MEVSG